MPRNKPVMMMCTYRPKRGKEKQLLSLVKKHWRTLHRAGLTTDEPAQIFRAFDKRGDRTARFIELFSWKNERSSALAHEVVDVVKIWEPMAAILDEGPSPELAVIERIRG